MVTHEKLQEKGLRPGETVTNIPYRFNFRGIILWVWLIWMLTATSCKDQKEYIKPTYKDITESVYASGVIKSKNQYEVLGRVNGVIEKIFVREGMRVKKGDPILQIYNQEMQLAAENARLTSSAADYKTNADKLEDARKEVALLEKMLEQDSLLWMRQKNLWSQDIGSQLELEQKKLAYENTKVKLANAKTRYIDVKRQLKLNSDQSKISLRQARVTEGNYLIRSEVDGLVFQLNKTAGEFVNGQEAIAVIGNDDYVIELNIDEMDIVKIKNGQEVIVRLDSYRSQVFNATISFISPMMNSRTRTGKAEAVFKENPERLFPYLTLEANIIIQTRKHVLTIPRKYLLQDSKVMLKGGTIQPVEVGLMDLEVAEIKSGIDENTELEMIAP